MKSGMTNHLASLTAIEKLQPYLRFQKLWLRGHCILTIP